MIATLGMKTLEAVAGAKALIQLFWEASVCGVGQTLKLRFRLRETIEQIYFAAVESIPVVVFSLVLVSVMLILEFDYHSRLVLRQDSLVPGFSTMFLLRELAPVWTALLLTSRV